MSVLDILELLTALLCLVAAAFECIARWPEIRGNGNAREGRPKHLRE